MRRAGARPNRAWFLLDCRLPESNGIRRGRGWAEPQIWFRIVHVAVDGSSGAPAAAYRERAAPARVRNRKPPKAPRTPRVVDLLRKAIERQPLLEAGEASSQAAIARQEGITRARVTQVMGLLRLAPEIQEHVLSLPNMVRRPVTTERALRRVAQFESASDQEARFQKLMAQASR